MSNPSKKEKIRKKLVNKIKYRNYRKKLLDII